MNCGDAKALLKYFKRNATFVAFGMYFDDARKQVFIQEFPLKNSRLFNYADINTDMWDEKTFTTNKGHPIIGSIIGNAIGGFGAGFVGALAGQQMSGKQVKYISGPSVTLLLNNSDKPYTHELMGSGPFKANGFMGWQYQKLLDKTQDFFCHVEGRPTPDEVMEDIWKS